MRRRYAPPPDDGNRWLISYSDFVTLLFAFFVVMYASASLTEDRYQVLSDTLHNVFDAQPRSFEPVQLGEPSAAASTQVVDVPESTALGFATDGDTHIEPSAQDIEERFAGLIAQDDLQVEANNDWLEISLPAALAFTNGSSELTQAAQQVLQTTADYLAGFAEPVTIEGYTDNVPTQTNQHPSNWALAGARAAAVADYFESQGIDRKRLSAVGYGDNHGVASNATPTGRERNRRVVVVVARRGNLARDLNALPASSAFAFVRHDEPKTLDDRIKQRRQNDGSLVFSN